MFYGRKNEVNLIRSVFEENNKAVLIYGKRRVGKTTLIKEAIKDFEFIYFECLEDTVEKNIDSFIVTLNIKGITIPSYVSFKDFIDVFFLLRHFSFEELLKMYLTKYADGSEYRALLSMSYFADADPQPMPYMFENIDWEVVKDRIRKEVEVYSQSHS